MERDDLIVNDSYAVAANHDEEHGKEIRKGIWKVTLILTAVTIFEVFIGATVARGTDWWTPVKWGLIILTLFKAFYIVWTFMHLGDERKGLKWAILAPYIIFILYLIFIAITESTYAFDMFYGGPPAE